MVTKQDFDEIVLLPIELKELRRFQKESPLKECNFPALTRYRLVEPDFAGSDEEGCPIFAGTYSIRDKGIRYLAYRKLCKKQALSQYLANKWIDFLALIVSVFALIISIIALRHSLPVQ